MIIVTQFGNAGSNSPGKYYTQSFSILASGGVAQEALFQQITNFANTYELDIKVVGKMEESFSKEIIPVIFEKRQR